jgi:hypothetical protein
MSAQGRLATKIAACAVVAAVTVAGYRLWPNPEDDDGHQRGRREKDPQTTRAAVNQRRTVAEESYGDSNSADSAASRRPSAADCGKDHLPADGGLCRPVDGLTGAAYAEEQLLKFDEMRASPYVAKSNYFVPQMLTVAEARSRRDLFAQMNSLADLITNHQATADQIEEFFRFRERLTHYRMQILSYQHASAGGRTSPSDPALDPNEITDPELKARYTALDTEQKTDFQQWTRARAALGLPPQTYLTDQAAGSR